MSVAGEVTDTSIVEVGRSRPQFQYSRVNIALKLLKFLKIICQVLLLAIYKVNVNGWIRFLSWKMNYRLQRVTSVAQWCLIACVLINYWKCITQNTEFLVIYQYVSNLARKQASCAVGLRDRATILLLIFILYVARARACVCVCVCVYTYIYFIYFYFLFFFQEDLMLIKNLRLSRRRPTFLDIAYNK